nr:MAG TPA: hypothetical protein [Caudoviricetes sp.]
MYHELIIDFITVHYMTCFLFPVYIYYNRDKIFSSIVKLNATKHMIR